LLEQLHRFATATPMPVFRRAAKL